MSSARSTSASSPRWPSARGRCASAGLAIRRPTWARWCRASIATRCWRISRWRARKAPPSSPAAACPCSATPATPAPTWNRPSGPACPSARCIKEEVFGPVCHVAPFDTEEEAIRLANDSRYGLAAAVWTQNLTRGHRVAQSMKAGLAWVNCWFLRDLRTPFGGSGLSGIGREGGRHCCTSTPNPPTSASSCDASLLQGPLMIQSPSMPPSSPARPRRAASIPTSSAPAISCSSPAPARACPTTASPAPRSTPWAPPRSTSARRPAP